MNRNITADKSLLLAEEIQGSTKVVKREIVSKVTSILSNEKLGQGDIALFVTHVDFKS